MTSLPFYAFEIRDGRVLVCYIDTDLGDNMFLFNAGDGKHVDEHGRRLAHSWWIGRFVHTEGIGCRQMVDAQNIDVMMDAVGEFEDVKHMATKRPSGEKIAEALDRIQKIHYLFIRSPIRVID